MPELEWSLLCEYCLIDAAGKLSMLGIFEQMLTLHVPAFQPMLFVVSRWRSEPQQVFKVETRLWTPTEQVLQTTGEVLVAPSPVGQNLTINQFTSLTFEREGQYLVELLVDGETARYYPWQLTVRPAPGAPASA
ncbi:MAG TPA: hypothetical protein VK066_31255 [Chloroflexota bacterium]|nr:hypothetical protein [Chloroflexota bacterium]